jgi:hypothetical protein
MKRTPEKQAEIDALPKYWVKIQAQTEKAQKYNYTKLVSSEKANRLIYGQWNGVEFKKTTKIDYKIVS